MDMRRIFAVVAAVVVMAAVPAVASASVLTWSSCATQQEPSAECATVEVPIDRARPELGSARLALARLPARDRSHRIGSLLVNPGGPGGSGVGFAQSGGLASPDLAPLRERFDVVGFDPRGDWYSTPRITCDAATLYDPALNRFPSTRAGFEALVAHNRKAGADCLARTGSLLAYADTQSAAEDIETIRAALGEPKISWLGLSYGTELGAVYASKHPGRVRAMVLDGAIDHARPMRQAILEEAAATEDALVRFAAWCRGSAGCALHGQDVLRFYDDVVARAARSGIWSSELKRSATADEISAGVYGYLYIRDDWPALGTHLAAAGGEFPDARGLTERNQFLSPIYGAYRAIGCHDFPSPFTGPADLGTMARLLRAAAPHSWRYSEYWDFAAGCTGWPIAPKNPPQPHSVHGAPPILVIGGAHDPATPLPWARTLAASINGAALLTRTDDGHTGLFNSACTRAAEVVYLVDGVVPGRGAVCR
ncbi:alpha/beta hydrolase [Amycolatopsis rifamycinica]|uniref:Alpha/beta hydrolase n=1 Tax=Amycolatopsis rifamycinica TaxID=287986 RepID=A0A066TXA3_9PSEU|nr:alpha/beta hydrolase [Amycolatopsis rifamycinica]KDN19485.1 alpha/beta hydrolase [Amycolatopsis rifamycinica]